MTLLNSVSYVKVKKLKSLASGDLRASYLSNEEVYVNLLVYVMLSQEEPLCTKELPFLRVSNNYWSSTCISDLKNFQEYYFHSCK